MFLKKTLFFVFGAVLPRVCSFFMCQSLSDSVFECRWVFFHAWQAGQVEAWSLVFGVALPLHAGVSLWIMHLCGISLCVLFVVYNGAVCVWCIPCRGIYLTHTYVYLIQLIFYNIIYRNLLGVWFDSIWLSFEKLNKNFSGVVKWNSLINDREKLDFGGSFWLIVFTCFNC